jgi:hypothetical protein
MAQRYSFIVVLSFLLGAIGWWSDHIRSLQDSVPAEAEGLSAEGDGIHRFGAHRELIELLDRMVSYEHYYRSVYGRFTTDLGRIGVGVPRLFREQYQLRAVEVSHDRLVITASSESNGRLGDLVSIDQDFRLHASFPVPAPRLQYLKSQAFKHLRSLRDAPGGQLHEEQGVYRGYFSYEIRHDMKDRRVAVATGVRAPVVGVELEMGQGMEMADVEAELLSGESPAGGEVAEPDHESVAGDDGMTTLEEAYLAQRIFHGELGRYARNWSELSRVAHFKFSARGQFGEDALPFGENTPPRESMPVTDKVDATRGLSSQTDTQGGSPDLEIVPLDTRQE